MPSPNQVTGAQGERVAERFLRERNYIILTRNFRFKHVEIDLIALDGDQLVFVEVKTRKSRLYGDPEDSVTRLKQRHLILAARAYIYQNRLQRLSCRFDVISIVVGRSAPRIEHFQDAFFLC